MGLVLRLLGVIGSLRQRGDAWRRAACRRATRTHLLRGDAQIAVRVVAAGWLAPVVVAHGGRAPVAGAAMLRAVAIVRPVAVRLALVAPASPEGLAVR